MIYAGFSGSLHGFGSKNAPALVSKSTILRFDGLAGRTRHVSSTRFCPSDASRCRHSMSGYIAKHCIIIGPLEIARYRPVFH
jgi:hypothetical protein